MPLSTAFPPGFLLLCPADYPQHKKGEKMKLTIYENKKPVKVYTTETYDLMFGTVEDIANSMNLDALQTGTDTEIIGMAAQLIRSNMDTVKDLLKDIFDGLTDEEIKKTKIKEIAKVLVDVVKFTITQLKTGDSKN